MISGDAMTCAGCSMGSDRQSGQDTAGGPLEQHIEPARRAAGLKAACWLSIHACSRSSRSSISSADTVARMSAAGVPGRGEYLNEKAPANPILSTSARVAGKSSSVSLGNPTMKSDENAMSCRAHTNVDDVEIFGGGVLAVHRREDAVRSGLYRQMHVRHQRRQIAMRPRSGCRPCRRDGWWNSATSRRRDCRDPMQQACPASMLARRVPRRDRR